ncbi:MAG: diaminopropionate ammonia-lyase [Firmicutes bacterium]|nr:diaminopropionate ammonia-lyase [Bacillota bacterium]
MDAIHIEYLPNTRTGDEPVPEIQDMSTLQAKKIGVFHQSWPEYHPTPLRNLDALSSYLGVSAIRVKDESQRFGIGAFKVLGSTWAIGRYLADAWSIPLDNLTFESLHAEAKAHEPITFTAASDGNHGLGVAWTAQQLGQRAVIYLPKGTIEERVARIRRLGAIAEVTTMNYDDTVRQVALLSRQRGWVMVQDTSWDGYHDIPLWVMQGYLTMVREAEHQWNLTSEKPPTHIIIQAGVGSLAGSVVGWFAGRNSGQVPVIVIAEPMAAPALYRSAAAGGQPVKISGSLDTIMAGLACGEPNPEAWKIIRSRAYGFVVCNDVVAARGTRILSNPLNGDPVIATGESGSMPLGLLATILDQSKFVSLRAMLDLGTDARILLFNTEGVTDPDLHRELVWDGKYCV